MMEIRSMTLTHSKAHSQFMPALKAISTSLETYGHRPITAVMTDMPRIDKPELENTLPSLLADVVPVPDITTLPKLTIPTSEWNVTELGSRFQVNTRLNTIMGNLSDAEDFHVALDMEWSVDIENGIQGQVALVSIAFNHEILLIPLHKFWHEGELPSALLIFLRSSNIHKVGVKVNADMKRLFADCKFTEKDQPFVGAVELGHMAKQKNIAMTAGIGLADLAAQVLKRFLPKDPSVRVSTAWDNPELSNTQKSYAALDVYATWQVFEALNSTSSGSSITQTTPGGTSISLLSPDRSTIVAHGIITPDQPKALCGVNVTKTRIVVTVTSILVPGHIVSGELMHSKEDTPFNAFPPTPFHLVCKLKHLQTCEPEILTRTSCPAQTPQSIVYSTPTATTEPGHDLEHTENLDQVQWYNDTDSASESDQDPAQSVADSTGVAYAALLNAIEQTLETRASSSGIKRSGVFGDIWHLMHQFPISMQHGLRRPFARSMRNAFFLYDPEDKAAVEAFLATKGITWDKMLLYHSHWLFQRVKRYVPPPEELLPRVSQVLQTFGPLKDAKTGAPLFNQKCWEIATNALENIRRGFYSDPPNVTLYYPQKPDKFGLSRYRCCRGTNGIEGGVHQNIIRWFGSFNAAPDLALELLRDYALYHNLKIRPFNPVIKVGTFNRTGVPYSGSYDVWTRNRISKLLDITSTHFVTQPPEFGPGGWVNGDNFARSTETFGILQLPSELRGQLGMLAYHPGFAQEVKIRHQYLAQRQGTRIAILPVHTSDERSIFKLLIVEQNGLFSGVNEPKWFQVAERFNSHANGLTIFYKLPEQLKAFWKKWQENSNEKSSISINQAAFDNIVHTLSLSSSSLMPVATGHPQAVRDQINMSAALPSGQTPVEDWHISNALGRHALQQSTIHFHYGEHAPNPTHHVDKGKKRALDSTRDIDDHEPVKVSTRKIRTCRKCGKAGAPSIFSIKKARRTYARQGGISTIFTCDDGL
ncbi:hypothetical protein H0H93_009317 [Arthromyces matolae]|nr:hypothetical protein H0H93_009317 [Arthromyces matolae]